MSEPVIVNNVIHWTRDMEKQVGARVGIVMSNPRLLSVFQRFGAGVFRRSSVFHGLEQFLVDNDVRGECCVEIGTWNGLTAIVLSQFFNRVVTIDVVSNPIKHDIIRHLGVTNIRCVDITSNEEKPSVMASVEFDCAYLDGNHAEDTETDFDLVKRCGRAVFHEAWQHQSPVWTLLHCLPRHQIVLGGCGLALWDASRPVPPSTIKPC